MSPSHIYLFLCILSCGVFFVRSQNATVVCPWHQHIKASVNKVSYKNAQIWRALIDTEQKEYAVDICEQNLMVQNWGIDEENHHDIFVDPKHIKEVTKKFKQNNISTEVVTANFQDWIDEENPASDEANKGPHKLTWTRYHRLDDINSFLHYLSVEYRNICSIHTIGKSIEGRPLRLTKLSNGEKSNKAIWIDGGIHGREWISPAVVTYLMNYLVKNWEREKLERIDWHILPVLNPDGYEFSHTHDRLWRKNRSLCGSCYGTDLNRNFEYAWGQPGSSPCPCHNVYCGPHALSEPETQAVTEYVTDVDAKEPNDYWKAFLTFHSFGQGIYYPGSDLKSMAKTLAKTMKSVNGVEYDTVATDNVPIPGAEHEWAKNIVKIKYAFAIELRDKGRRGFVLPSCDIVPNGEEVVAAVMKLSEAIM